MTPAESGKVLANEVERVAWFIDSGLWLFVMAVQGANGCAKLHNDIERMASGLALKYGEAVVDPQADRGNWCSRPKDGVVSGGPKTVFEKSDR